MIIGFKFNRRLGKARVPVHLSTKNDKGEAVGPHPLESVLGAEKRFSAFMDMLLDKKSSPVDEVVDTVSSTDSL